MERKDKPWHRRPYAVLHRFNIAHYLRNCCVPPFVVHFGCHRSLSSCRRSTDHAANFRRWSQQHHHPPPTNNQAIPTVNSNRWKWTHQQRDCSPLFNRCVWLPYPVASEGIHEGIQSRADALAALFERCADALSAFFERWNNHLANIVSPTDNDVFRSRWFIFMVVFAALFSLGLLFFCNSTEWILKLCGVAMVMGRIVVKNPESIVFEFFEWRIIVSLCRIMGERCSYIIISSNIDTHPFVLTIHYSIFHIGWGEDGALISFLGDLLGGGSGRTIHA